MVTTRRQREKKPPTKAAKGTSTGKAKAAGRASGTVTGRRAKAAADEESSTRPKNESFSFQDRLVQLNDFKTEHRHLLVPDKYEEYGLGAWVRNTRSKKKRGRLKNEEKKQLDKIGFVWEVNSSAKFELNDEAWDKSFNSLLLFKNAKEHCDVQLKDDAVLYRWVSRQRTAYRDFMERQKAGVKKKDDEKLEERMNRLKEIDFIFDLQEYKWGLRYSELLEYERDFGDCDIPDEYDEKPELGKWVGVQRRQYWLLKEPRNDGKRSSQSSMTDERIKLLEAAGFVWRKRGSKKCAPKKKASKKAATKKKSSTEEEPPPSVPSGAPEGVGV